MTAMQNLYEKINAQKISLRKHKPEIFEIPAFITDNLKHNFFEWQKEALENLLIYCDGREEEYSPEPLHLMFNMATGSGKTLLMAAAILYYYEQGYKHFLFFVNRNNIVDKTENNFIDNTHTKYLFKEKISLNNKPVSIKNVDVFSDEPQGIEIKFTSIQKLYNDIHLEKENQTTLEDLHRKDIVMLADEAHHLNTSTQNTQEEILSTEITNRTSAKTVERKGWEDTVINLILYKDKPAGNNKNVLLEFTATIPENENVSRKYQDKIIYKFVLKDFLKKGYTKEINLTSSTLEKKQRVLHALVFQWYRHEIALKNGIANFKPVILFRSKTIAESKKDHEEFLDWVNSIKVSDLNFLVNVIAKMPKSESIHEQGINRTQQIFEFIEKNNSRRNIIQFIKDNFAERNVIITNSKGNKKGKEKTDEQQEKLLNSLEDKNNHIRGIFTVDRLTEGWDVHNLFDIVRLYKGQNAGGNTRGTPKTTTKEIQLIGRGVRYFPFAYPQKEANQRKFDNDLTNELRALEELYYYTYDEESKYISDLKNELKKEGYIDTGKKPKTFALKPEFKKTDFYKQTKIWQNEQKDNPDRRKNDLEHIKENFEFSHKISETKIKEDRNFFITEGTSEKQNATRKPPLYINCNQIEKHIFRKALHIKAGEKELLQFANLKEELKIDTMDELQPLLIDLEIEITNTEEDYENIDNKAKLKMTLKFLDKVINDLKQNIHPKIGTKEFYPASFENVFGEPKTKVVDTESHSNSTDIIKDEWYILDDFVGTSEERDLLKFIDQNIGYLKEKYDEVYFLRNEEVYKIYDFEEGRGFQPDFLLFLKSRDTENLSYYQIFIEPKGDQWKDENGKFSKGKEGWKENFLLQIEKEHDKNTENIFRLENKKYKLIGLPFYNTNTRKRFRSAFNEKILPEN